MISSWRGVTSVAIASPKACAFIARGRRRVLSIAAFCAKAPADIVVFDLDKLRRVPAIDYEVAHDFPANERRRIQRAEGYR